MQIRGFAVILEARGISVKTSLVKEKAAITELRMLWRINNACQTTRFVRTVMAELASTRKLAYKHVSIADSHLSQQARRLKVCYTLLQTLKTCQMHLLGSRRTKEGIRPFLSTNNPI